MRVLVAIFVLISILACQHDGSSSNSTAQNPGKSFQPGRPNGDASTWLGSFSRLTNAIDSSNLTASVHDILNFREGLISSNLGISYEPIQYFDGDKLIAGYYQSTCYPFFDSNAFSDQMLLAFVKPISETQRGYAVFRNQSAGTFSILIYDVLGNETFESATAIPAFNTVTFSSNQSQLLITGPAFASINLPGGSVPLFQSGVSNLTVHTGGQVYANRPSCGSIVE